MGKYLGIDLDSYWSSRSKIKNIFVQLVVLNSFILHCLIQCFTNYIQHARWLLPRFFAGSATWRTVQIGRKKIPLTEFEPATFGSLVLHHGASCCFDHNHIRRKDFVSTNNVSSKATLFLLKFVAGIEPFYMVCIIIIFKSLNPIPDNINKGRKK